MFLTRIIDFIRATYTDTFKLACHPVESVKSLHNVSLYRNAVYLMANSGVTALLGVVFWIVVTRLYPDEDVGLGSALISSGLLLSFIGTLGLGFGIIRFLPESNDKSRLLNSSLFITVITSVVAALIFLAGLSLWSPKLEFVRENPVYFMAFIFFIVGGALNTILNQTFVGFRRSGFTLTKGIINSAGKLIFVAVLAAFSKTFGIFSSWGLSIIVSFGIGIIFFLPEVLPGFRPFPFKSGGSIGINKSNIAIIRFSFANYVGHILQNLPGWILPLMVLSLITAVANAHFYVVWTMASLLLNISTMTSMSLFAEVSNNGDRLRAELGRSLKLIVILLFPGMIFMFLLGDKLLLLFGSEYSDEGTRLLWIFTISALPASINLLYLGIARVEKNLTAIILVNGVLALGTLASSYPLILWLGILGGGYGWLATQSIVALVIAYKLVKRAKML